MEAIYEKDKTLIPAPIWENVDDSMKDEDFRNNPLPRHMIFEKYRREVYGEGERKPLTHQESQKKDKAR